MPSNKQRRQAAQRHLQRQLERRAELARKRRRNLLIVVTVAAVVLVAGAVWLISGVGGDDDETTTAGGTSESPAVAAEAPVPPVVNPDGTVTCDFAPDGSGTDVGLPPDEAATAAQGTSTLAVSTSAGDMTFTLDRAKAPCAASSFTHLASVGFFDGSPCHRMVNQPTFGVLQCGDPTGTGTGGPGYRFYEEVTPETTYPRGTIAMAKSNTPGSTGSQFFLCFVDTDLPPDYTPVGTVDEAGLVVLDQIAAAGNDGSFEPAPGGGAPNTPVTITSVTVVQ